MPFLHLQLSGPFARVLSVGGNLNVLLEFFSHRSLLMYLRSKKESFNEVWEKKEQGDVDLSDLIRLAVGAANGLAFLESKKVIPYCCINLMTFARLGKALVFTEIWLKCSLILLVKLSCIWGQRSSNEWKKRIFGGRIDYSNKNDLVLCVANGVGKGNQ